MDSTQSANFVSSLGGDFEWLSEATSTNSLLLAKGSAPHFSVIATDNQVAGRGRSGRSWQAPAGASLAISVLLKPQLSSASLNQLAWLPLLAGLAMSRVVKAKISADVGVKWPNDVLVGERKISGILSELSQDLRSVVVGAGLNVNLAQADLPVPTATSLAIAGSTANEFDPLILSYLENFNQLYSEFETHGFDANLSGLRQSVIETCVTLGREIRAILPGDKEVLGHAVAIDDTGRLVLDVEGKPFAVAAGDIVHMRHN
jgi:BirA family biotin operon repressor/biotin-[acetyl-CoA-carboxylase] ligase